MFGNPVSQTLYGLGGKPVCGNGPKAGGAKLDIFTHRAGIILKNGFFFTLAENDI